MYSGAGVTQIVAFCGLPADSDERTARVRPREVALRPPGAMSEAMCEPHRFDRFDEESMGKCELSLELDQAEPFRCGEKVRGRVIVVATEALRVDGSKVKMFFETRGKGTRHQGDEIVDLGGPFELAAGARHEVPFELPLPEGPISFEGELISVAWLLRAELDVPWALDPKEDREIVVVPASPTEPPGGSYREAPTPDDPDAGTSPAATAAKPSEISTKAMVLLAVLGAIALFLMWQNAELSNQATRHGRNAHLHFYLTAALGLFFAWKLAGRRILNAFAARGLGQPDVTASSARRARGEAVDVTVVLDPPGVADVSRIVAKLVYTETARWGGNRNRNTKEHVVETDLATLVENAVVERGRAQTFTGSLRVPEGMAPSLSVPSNTISWQIVVTIVPKSGLDHVTEIPIEVVG